MSKQPTDESRARAAEKVKLAAARAEAGAEAKADYEANAKAVEANSGRLKALRLARDAADAELSKVKASAPEKARRRKTLVSKPEGAPKG